MGLKSWLKNKYLWLGVFSVFLISRVATGYFSKAVNIYTASLVRNYAEGLIAECMEEEVLKDLESADLFIEKYDANGKVSYATIDSSKINKIRNRVILYTDRAIATINEHEDLKKIKIPAGYLIGLKYFFVDGFEVPIQMQVIGNQDVELKTNTISKGINTTIIEIYLDISVNVQVVIPFQNQITVTSTQIPLAIEVMNNDIPYYLGDFFQ